MGAFRRDERGQTAADSMGLMLLVALIIAAIVATGLHADIASGVRTAICQIIGGTCDGTETGDTDLEPCLVSSSENSSNFKVFVGVVEVGKDSVLLREDFSDGTTRFTLIDSTELKGELFAGVRAKAGKYGLSAAAQAAAGGHLKGAQVFEVPTEDAERFEESVAAAGGFDGLLRDVSEINDEIPILGWDNPLDIDNWVLDQLGVDKDDPIVDPTEEYIDVAAIADADAGAGAGIGVLDGEVAAAVNGAAGAKVIHEGERAGEVELYFQLEGEAGGTLTAGLLGPNVEGEASVVATLVLGDDGEPKSLKVTGAAGYTGALGLDQEIEGLDATQIHELLEEASLSATSGDGSAVEASAELDLTDPANRAAALRLLAPGARGPAVADLLRRFDEDGTLTLDFFDISQDETEGEIKVGLGVGGGAGGGSSSEDKTATGSYVREPGGTFQERECAQ
jgi:hypothetical protein